MGNWNISIRGVGVHHNQDLAADADRMARRFVKELLDAGHTVVSAEITYGGAEALTGDQSGSLHFDPAKKDDKGNDQLPPPAPPPVIIPDPPAPPAPAADAVPDPKPTV